MSERTLLRRYIEALYQEAEARDLLDAISEDVAFLEASLDESGELRQTFESPVIPREKKHTIVDRLFDDAVEGLFLRFLHLLIDQGREELIQEFVQRYGDFRNEKQGMVEAMVRTATPLSSEEQEALAARLEELTGKGVRLRVEQNNELLGGLLVRVGDTVYDGTVRHKLDALEERFKQRTFASNGA